MAAPGFLPYGRHGIDDDDVAAVVEVLRGEHLTTGPTVARFEQAVAERVGARHGVACANGTAALHLAALALKLGPGDAVAVPSLTFLATANAARYVGAEVAFCDVDPATGLVRAEDVAAAMASAPAPVKAVVPVHLNGQCADMAAIGDLAAREGLAVVEDACHALGGDAEGGGPVGNCRHSAMTVFSFHPVKTVAMGEGGLVSTNDHALDRRLRRLRNHGMVREPETFALPDLAFDTDGQANPWHYEMPELGFNYRASDIACALGLSQLGKLAAFVDRRRALAERYDRLLAPLAPHVRPIARVPGQRPAWHLYVVRIDFAAIGMTRAQVAAHLMARGIGTQVHYLPVHMQPYYRRRYGRLSLPGAEAYYRSALTLPLFPAMADHDVDRVVEALTECARR